MNSIIQVPETNQTLHVRAVSLSDTRAHVVLNGEGETFSLDNLRATADRHAEPHIRRFWTQVVGMVQQDREAKVAEERRRQCARVRECKNHMAVSETEPRCYFGPVSRVNENPAAHGNIEVTETCRCGAQRDLNINGCHIEEGAWYAPLERGAS